MTGPEQVRPANFTKYLRNAKFKEAVVHFLINHCGINKIVLFLSTKTMHLNFDNYYRFNAVVDKTELPSVSSEEQEEANTTRKKK